MRRSSSPCSFFAAWYSKFSERSPCPRAIAIASTTACRFGPSSSASSASSCSRSARVSCSPRSSASVAAAARAAAAPAAAAAAAAEARRLRRAVHGERRELPHDVRRGAVRAGDLLLAADELFEVRLALHADVFVDRHRPEPSNRPAARTGRRFGELLGLGDAGIAVERREVDRDERDRAARGPGCERSRRYRVRAHTRIAALRELAASSATSAAARAISSGGSAACANAWPISQSRRSGRSSSVASRTASAAS